MSTGETVPEPPRARDVGGRRDAKGYKENWRGYRPHVDAADGDIPVSRVPAPASPRDSQATIPLSRMTGERVDHRHGLMDAAHHSRETGAHARLAGRVPVTGTSPRRDAGLGERLAREAPAQRMAGHIRHGRVRQRRRPGGGRVNSTLRDPYGGRHVRVRGHAKVARRTPGLATAAGTANNCARGSRVRQCTTLPARSPVPRRHGDHDMIGKQTCATPSDTLDLQIRKFRRAEGCIPHATDIGPAKCDHHAVT